MIRGRASVRRDGKRETRDRSGVCVELAMIRFVIYDTVMLIVPCGSRARLFCHVCAILPTTRSPERGQRHASHSAGDIRQHGSRVNRAGTSH